MIRKIAAKLIIKNKYNRIEWKVEGVVRLGFVYFYFSFFFHFLTLVDIPLSKRGVPSLKLNDRESLHYSQKSADWVDHNATSNWFGEKIYS